MACLTNMIYRDTKINLTAIVNSYKSKKVLVESIPCFPTTAGGVRRSHCDVFGPSLIKVGGSSLKSKTIPMVNVSEFDHPGAGPRPG